MNTSTPLAAVQRAAWDALNLASSHRGARVVLTLLLAAVALLTVSITTAAPALAACAPPGVPNAAGSGMPGFFDPATPEPSGDNYYGLYGYGGLRWNNCELGGPIAGNEWAGDPNAGLDTLIGNVFLAVATFLGSISTALHKWIGNSTELLAPMDTFITQLSALTRNVIITNWFPVVLLAGAVLFFAAVLSQNRRKALTTVIMSMLAIGIIGVLDTIPMTVAHLIDDVASDIQAETDTKALETAGIRASKEEALGALYMDTLIWPHWAAGATNATNLPNPRSVTDGSDAPSFEDRIYVAGTTPFARLAQDADEQRDQYEDLAGEMKTAEPKKFQALKGQSYNRTSNGFLAMVKVLPVAAFRIPAEAAIFLTLVIMRFIPIVGPIFALFLIFPSTRALAFKHGRSLFSSIIHTIVVTFFASIHVAAVAFFFTNLNAGFAIILTFVVTIIFFKWAKPMGALAQLIPGGAKIANKVRHSRSERRQNRNSEHLDKHHGHAGQHDGHGGRHAGRTHTHGQMSVVGNERRVGHSPAPRWRTVQPVGPQHHGHEVRADHVGPQRVTPERVTPERVRPERVRPERTPSRTVDPTAGPAGTRADSRADTRDARATGTGENTTRKARVVPDSTPQRPPQGRGQVAPDTARVEPARSGRTAPVPSNDRSAPAGTTPRTSAGTPAGTPEGTPADDARVDQGQPSTTGGRRIGQERTAGASMSDREAAARGYFVPPNPAGTVGDGQGGTVANNQGAPVTGTPTGGADTGRQGQGAPATGEGSRNSQRRPERIFVPPEVEARDDAANADRIGK